MPALIAIPLAGTQRTLLGTAALLALSASFLLGRRVLIVAVVLAALVALPPGAVKAERGPSARGGLALPVHPGRRASGRPPAAPAQRGRRGPLRLAAGHGAHRRRLGHVPGCCRRCSTRPLRSVAILGNAGGTTARALGVVLSRRARRRRRARSRRQPGRAALVRHGGQPAPDGARRRRAALPSADGRALRPDHRRRLSPAVRALLPGDAGVLPPRARAARAGRDPRAQRRVGARRREPARRDLGDAHTRVRPSSPSGRRCASTGSCLRSTIPGSPSSEEVSAAGPAQLRPLRAAASLGSSGP